MRIVGGFLCEYIGISWEYHGNIMGISWEYHGNIMGISWEFGWWLSHPSEKMSQLGLFPIYVKIKNVPNHQPYGNMNDPNLKNIY